MAEVRELTTVLQVLRQTIGSSFDDNNVVAIYEFGSTICGNTTSSSDIDILIVVRGWPRFDKESTQTHLHHDSFVKGNLEVEVYSEDDFIDLLISHDMAILATYFTTKVSTQVISLFL